jgi:uncharacterized protein YacL
VLDYIHNWLSDIQHNYGVNPIVFGIIYCVSVVPFWLSIYKIIAGIKNRKTAQVSTFGIILGITIIAPFVYVALFGRNLPIWFWIIAVLVIAYSIYSVLRRIKK